MIKFLKMIACYGFGKYCYTSGNIYEGDWKNDIKEGKGVLTFSTGDIYDGNWLTNKRDGYGIYIYNSGDRYYGVWKGDVKRCESKKK